MSILSMRGDYLPRHKLDHQSGEWARVRPRYKDGETPGQEWTRRETLAIRTLANPGTSDPRKAARLCAVSLRKIKIWMRNPYFMNAVYELTSYNLNLYRARIYQALIESALGNSYQDRQLFFRLTGELKSEVNKKINYHYSGAEEGTELDDQIKRDVSDLTDGAAGSLETFSKCKPKREEP